MGSLSGLSPGPALTPLGNPREPLSQALGGQGSTTGCCDGTGGWARARGAHRGSSPLLGSAPGVSRFWFVQPNLPQQSPGKPHYSPGWSLAPWVPHSSCRHQEVTSLLVPHFPQSPGVPGTPQAGIGPRQGSGPARPPRPRSGAPAEPGQHVLSHGAFPPGTPVLPIKGQLLPSPAGSGELIAQGAVTVFYCNYFSC